MTGALYFPSLQDETINRTFRYVLYRLATSLKTNILNLSLFPLVTLQLWIQLLCYTYKATGVDWVLTTAELDVFMCLCECVCVCVCKMHFWYAICLEVICLNKYGKKNIKLFDCQGRDALLKSSMSIWDWLVFLFVHSWNASSGSFPTTFYFFNNILKNHLVLCYFKRKCQSPMCINLLTTVNRGKALTVSKLLYFGAALNYWLL